MGSGINHGFVALCLAVILVVFSVVSPTAHADTVKVRLFSVSPVAEVEVTGSKLRVGADGRVLAGDYFVFGADGEGVVFDNGRHAGVAGIVSVESSRGMTLRVSGTKSRNIRGKLTLYNFGGNLRIIARLDLEDYVAGCVAGEMPLAEREAMRAQAVAVRSFALENPGRHGDVDFCDSTHCQHFAGCPHMSSPFFDAAMSTAGLVIYRKGRPGKVFYHSTCGGHTASGGDVFGGEGDFFPGVSDTDSEGRAYCRHSPHFRWDCNVTQSRLARIFPLLPMPVEQVKITRRASGGRALQVVLSGKGRTHGMRGYHFWQEMGNHLGWGEFESAWFEVTREKDEFLFTGRGLGHGVGMCQYGAMELARQGRSFLEILEHYFPRCQVRSRGAGN